LSGSGSGCWLPLTTFGCAAVYITSSVAFDLEECCRAMLMARRPAFPPLTSENDKVHFGLCHRFNLLFLLLFLLFVSGFLTVKKSPARSSTVQSSR
jgi:hypothetical protein